MGNLTRAQLRDRLAEGKTVYFFPAEDGGTEQRTWEELWAAWVSKGTSREERTEVVEVMYNPF